MNKKGVVDRIVNGKAVILIEESMEELILDVNEYHIDEGDILTITFSNNEISNVEINIKEMKSMKKIIDSKLDKLRKRNSKYKKHK